MSTPNDGLDGPRRVNPPRSIQPPPPALAPTAQSMLERAESEIAEAEHDANSHVDEQLSAIESEINQSEGEVNVALGSMMGGIENDLMDAQAQAERSVDRAIDTHLTTVLEHETHLQNAGFHVPVDTNQIANDLADDTGESIVARMMGIVPAPHMATEESAGAPFLKPTPPLASAIVDTGQLTTQPVPITEVPTNVQLPAVTTEPAQVAPPPQPVPQPVCCPPPIINVNVAPCQPTSPSGTPAEEEPTPEVVVEPVPVDIQLNLPKVGTQPASPPPVPVPMPVPPPPPINLEVIVPETGGGGGGTGGGAGGPPEGGFGPVEYPYAGLHWSGEQVCKDADTAAKKWTASGTGFAFTDQGRASGMSAVFRGSSAALKTFLDSGFAGFSERSKNAFFDANLKLTSDFMGGYSAAVQTITMLDATVVPQKDIAWNLGLVLAQARKAEESSGFPLTYLTVPLEYLYQYSNPQKIPEQAELNDLAARFQIDPGLWYCLTKAHGNIPDLQSQVVASRRAQPAPDQLVRLKNMGKIDQTEYETRMGRAGFAEGVTRGWIEQLGMYIPGPSDLILFMVRDVFDPDVVKQYNLDKDFELKFFGPGGPMNPGQGALWAQSQGMTADVFRSNWRAHWHAPSDTQVFEAGARLREDRPAVKAWDRAHPQWVPGAPMPEGDPRPPVITMSDVKKIIEVNDLMPFWVDPVVAISYLPINRTDAITAYQAGVFSEEDLRNAMLDNRYAPDDAKRLVDIQRAVKARRLTDQSGLWTIREILRSYKEGIITGQTADGLLAPLVLDPRTRQDYLTAADAEVQAGIKREAVKRVRRAYYTGWYGDTDVSRELGQLQIPAQQQQNMLALWQQEKTGRYREPSAKMILGWMKSKVISVDQAFVRLTNLGYTQADAFNMTATETATEQAAAKKADKSQQQELDKLFKNQRAIAMEHEKEQTKREKALLAYQDKIFKELAKIKTQRLKGVQTEVKLLEKQGPVSPSDVERLDVAATMDLPSDLAQAEATAAEQFGSPTGG